MNELALPAIASVAGWTLVAVAGGLLPRLGDWYYALRKPSWQPPDWLFGPAWTLIFLLIAISSVMAWNAAAPAGRPTLLALLVVNGVLNIAWSGIFFTMRRPDWALWEVALLWLSILALVIWIWPISSTASLLLVPYLAWVSFASILNLAIVRLNPDRMGR